MTTFNQNNSNRYWQLAAWDGTTGYSKKGDAPWLWLVTLNFTYAVNDDLYIGTPGIKPHGGDIFNNIHEWRRINQTI